MTETEVDVRRRFLCLDCRADTHHQGISEFYVLQEWIWRQAAGPRDAGMLCIGCVEKRLGRRLVSSDFTDCPANIDERSSKRLKNRRSNEMSDTRRALRILIRALDTDDPHTALILEEVRKIA